MYYKFLSLILAVFLTIGVYAQDRATPDPEIRKAKIEFVTGSMSLTQPQMQQFLPLYNRYSDELLFQKRALKDLSKNPDSKYTVDQRQKIEQKMVDIKARYKNDFLKIISSQQLAAMYKAEEEFKLKMIERFKHEKR